MDKINLLKKYAYTYLSKYDSTKKNLEWKLKNKVMRMKNLESREKILRMCINTSRLAEESSIEFKCFYKSGWFG